MPRIDGRNARKRRRFRAPIPVPPFAALALHQGNSRNLQLVGVGDDGALYLAAWQSHATGVWTVPDTNVLAFQTGTFSAVALGQRQQRPPAGAGPGGRPADLPGRLAVRRWHMDRADPGECRSDGRPGAALHGRGRPSRRRLSERVRPGVGWADLRRRDAGRCRPLAGRWPHSQHPWDILYGHGGGDGRPGLAAAAGPRDRWAGLLGRLAQRRLGASGASRSGVRSTGTRRWAPR